MQRDVFTRRPQHYLWKFSLSARMLLLLISFSKS